MDNEKSGSQIPVDKHIIKKCKIDQTKMRKEHNKKSRNMVETAIGNLKSTSINKLTLVERDKDACNVTTNIARRTKDCSNG